MLDNALATVLGVLRNSIGDFVNVRARNPLATRHECWTVAEKLVHVFEVETFCLWLETPKEHGVGEVADDEDEVEFLSRVLVYSRGGR